MEAVPTNPAIVYIVLLYRKGDGSTVPVTRKMSVRPEILEINRV